VGPCFWKNALNEIGFIKFIAFDEITFLLISIKKYRLTFFIIAK